MTTTLELLIQEKLQRKLGLTLSVGYKQLKGSELDRKMFIESIEILQELDDRQQFMIEELGIDLITFEDKHFRVIENLFRMLYNEEQIMFIEKFIYNKQKPGVSKVVTLSFDGNDSVKMPFNTPEDLWEIIQILSE